MSKAVEIEIKLFGMFKKYASAGSISLNVSFDATVGDIKTSLGTQLCSMASALPNDSINGLVERSVLADEHCILKEDEVLGARRSLAILPPVCGG